MGLQTNMDLNPGLANLLTRRNFLTFLTLCFLISLKWQFIKENLYHIKRAGQTVSAQEIVAIMTKDVFCWVCDAVSLVKCFITLLIY